MKPHGPYSVLVEHFAAAVGQITGSRPDEVDPAVRPAGDPQFGDYQCNAALQLAKLLKAKPREIARRIVEVVQPRLADVAEPLEIAGPGFINIRLKADFLARCLEQIPAPPTTTESEPEAQARGQKASKPRSGEATKGREQEAGNREQRCERRGGQAPESWPADPGAGVPEPKMPAPASPGAYFPAFRPCHALFDRVGLPPVARPLRVVVEYSQPNIAKQMHVGHLRSTIIGDVFARVLSFQGHEVIRQNHIGDWGTQFGMLIRWYQEHPLPTQQTHEDVLEAIEEDYRAAQQRFESDPQFARQARQAVARLQAGDPEARRLWHRICCVSLEAIDEVYRRLGVLLRPEDVRGESFYNDRLPEIVEELRRKLPARADSHKAAEPGSHGTEDGRASYPSRTPDDEPPAPSPPSLAAKPPAYAEVRDDQGAVCVFMYDREGQPLFKNPDGRILPLIIQKSDGAYLYATTDLAAIRYRLKELRFASGVGAQRVIYVTDARQKLHFQMFLAVAHAAGWITPDVSVEHVTFGSVLGPDRKPLRTRAGGTIKLRELLDEAERRAYQLLAQRDQLVGESATPSGRQENGSAACAGDHARSEEPQMIPGQEERRDGRLSEEDKRYIAQRVGVAAVKYADLRNDRNADYVFDWDKMISLQGNTAPYMMYAYARIRSIYRKAAQQFGSPDVYGPRARIRIVEPQERALALRLARFGEVVDAVARDLLPHILCTYLYDLATDFMRFYESCPVLQACDQATRLSRMRLCDLTARTLKLGLALLGIEVIERM